MRMPIETVRGSHYEMGLQCGKAYRHVIFGNVHEYAMRHDFQGTDEQLDSALETLRASEKSFVPWVFEELEGIAEGSGVPLPWIVRMHLRVWNNVPKTTFSSGSGCTAIGMISESEGVIVGGTLDDPRQSEILIRRIPRDGIPHIQVAWAGTGWGQNGMNAEGLCVASSSLNGCEPPVPLDESQPRLRSSMAGRILLEKCKNVFEAVETLKRIQPTESYVLGDAAGNLVSCQSLGGFLQAFENPAEKQNFLFNTNHMHMADLTVRVAEHGSVPTRTEYSATRFSVLERARCMSPRSEEEMRRLLTSHDGYPNSICNDGTATAVYAKPQTRPGALFVADRPPCRNEFSAYSVEDATPSP